MLMTSVERVPGSIRKIIFSRRRQKYRAPPCDLQQRSLQAFNYISFTVGISREILAWLQAFRNVRCKFALPNPLRNRSTALFPSISLILNRKASRQHSPLSGALLHSKDFALHFNGKPSDLIGDSFEINFEDNTRSRWWAGRSKNKRAVFTDITAAAFSLSRLAVPIRPPECDCCLQ